MKPQKPEVFLRGVWKIIPDDSETEWVNRVGSVDPTKEPLGDYGTIVKDMLDKGVSPYNIARFAKIVGYEVAFGFCCHLDDPHLSYEGYEDLPEKSQWHLFEIEPETGEPKESLGGLHESILSLDPSGREMRPKDA